MFRSPPKEILCLLATVFVDLPVLKWYHKECGPMCLASCSKHNIFRSHHVVTCVSTYSLKINIPLNITLCEYTTFKISEI